MADNPPDPVTDVEVESIMLGMVVHGLLIPGEYDNQSVRNQIKQVCSMIAWLAYVRKL